MARSATFASSTAESSNDGRRPYEAVAAPDEVPLYDLVPVKGPEGETLDAYRGVCRRDTSEIVSVVSARYQLVQHREVAGAVYFITPPRLDFRYFFGGLSNSSWMYSSWARVMRSRN